MRAVQAASQAGNSHAGVLGVVVVAAMAAVFYPQFSLNHDAGWYVAATGRFLDGARLYEDIIEINPPLAFYLTIPPLAVARALGGNPTTSYFVYVCILCLASCLWTFRLLRHAALERAERNVLLLVVTVALFVLPVAEFGQREHLMLAFALPFLLSLILRPAMPPIGASHQIALALTASLGLLLKPHFLLIPASIAIMRLWQERSLRALFDPGLLALALAAIAYAVFVALAHPAYLRFIVPVAREVYAAYGAGAGRVLFKHELTAMLVGAIAALSGVRAFSNPITQRLASASVGAAAAYLIQFKGWNYHVLPLSAFVLLSAAWLCLCSARAIRRDLILVAGLAVFALMALDQQIARGPYQSRTTAIFKPYVKTDGESILVLSTNVWAGFPFVNEVSGRWASRFPAQWFIPGAHNRLQSEECTRNRASCGRAAEILNLARTAIIEDIARFRPDVIFIDERASKSYFQSRSFDYVEFLSEHPEFSLFRSCYRRIGSNREYGIFARTCSGNSGAADGASGPPGR